MLWSMIEEWKFLHPTPMVLGNASSQVNRMHPLSPVLGDASSQVNCTHSMKATRKKPRTGCLSSVAECLGFYQIILLELVNQSMEA
jgi:hypothetical protein